MAVVVHPDLEIETARARATEIRPKLSMPRPKGPVHFLSWVEHEVATEEGSRLGAGRGFFVETTLDPYLQRLAEQSMDQHLAAMRRHEARGRRAHCAHGL